MKTRIPPEKVRFYRSLIAEISAVNACIKVLMMIRGGGGGGAGGTGRMMMMMGGGHWSARP